MESSQSNLHDQVTIKYGTNPDKIKLKKIFKKKGKKYNFRKHQIHVHITGAHTHQKSYELTQMLAAVWGKHQGGSNCGLHSHHHHSANRMQRTPQLPTTATPRQPL